MIDWLIEPLSYPFMVRALGATVVSAVACGLLSCWLVQIGWSLMGDAVSHSVLPGVALAYIVGIPFAIGAFIFGIGAVLLIGRVQSSTQVKSDAAIGVVFTSLFALGIVIVSATPSQIDLTHILFGNVLGVSPAELSTVAVIGTLTVALVLVKRRDLTLFAFDPGHANAIGISVARLRWLLLTLLAMTVVVTMQTVGIILVVAMLVIPGCTARLLTRSMPGMLRVSVGVAVTASVVGVHASYVADVSTGGAVVLVQAALFALALGITGIRKVSADRKTRVSLQHEHSHHAATS
ncbi:metal ABC transporter permease [Paramicrobacterium chengjingii]|uniref:metal ABC transporter permease n=1 Tax=Paramicrobacterium chengjingii TaxID=2769067 RepID=UPI001AB03433|nr:metal ABC transporter permease [Microbacterium chengjingii]